MSPHRTVTANLAVDAVDTVRDVERINHQVVTLNDVDCKADKEKGVTRSVVLW